MIFIVQKYLTVSYFTFFRFIGVMIIGNTWVSRQTLHTATSLLILFPRPPVMPGLKQAQSVQRNVGQVR